MGAMAGALSGILSLVGGVVSAVGAVQQARAQAESERYQAQVAENNRIIADRNATWALQVGQSAEIAKGLQTRAAVGEARAALAANGIDVGSGSASEIVGAAGAMGMIDSMTIRSSAAREAHGFKSQGMNFTAEAQLHRMSADNALRAGALNAFSSILGGVTSFAGNFSRAGFGGGRLSFGTGRAGVV